MKKQYSIAGVDVFVEGEGETIVMVHGWPDTYRIWAKQINFFKKNYRCVYFTFPGFDVTKPRKAYSLVETTEILREIIDQVSPDQKVNLMLHDWGCFFGYQYYMQYPNRVARIIGIDIGDARSGDFVRSLTLKTKAMIFSYQMTLAGAWKLGGVAGDKMARTMAKALGAHADPQHISSDMGYPYYIQWFGSNGSYKKAKNIRPECPMFFAYAKRKPFMFHSQKWADALATQPQNQVVEFNSGHWVQVEAAADFNQQVGAWLAS
ncbi:MAG: alpha/beta hydrolase [Candidatus Saccharibacteria bacterium]|nr:alpha/beta hydrolase [Moraxellaceae bacterium]